MAEAQPIDRIDLLDHRDEVLQTTDMAQFSARYGHTSMAVLHRGGLHHALLSAIPEDKIHTGMTCIGAASTNDYAVLTFDNGEQILPLRGSQR